jgi:hypothetical protein
MSKGILLVSCWWLSNTEVTDTELNELKQALPKCSIRR